MIRKKMNKIKMSNKVGNEFKSDYTSFLIPGIEFTVLRGLRIRITLMADIFFY